MKVDYNVGFDIKKDNRALLSDQNIQFLTSMFTTQINEIDGLLE